MGAIKKIRDQPHAPPPRHVQAAADRCAFRLLLQRQAVRPRRGRFPVIGSSPHWPGGTGISNLRRLAGWISALERGRFQGHKQKRKLKSVAPFARNRKFESISLQRRVRSELLPVEVGQAHRSRQNPALPSRDEHQRAREEIRLLCGLCGAAGHPSRPRLGRRLCLSGPVFAVSWR